MRRGGYFATLSGRRDIGAAETLGPPHRLFAHEPVPFDLLAPAAETTVGPPRSPVRDSTASRRSLAERPEAGAAPPPAGPSAPALLEHGEQPLARELPWRQEPKTSASSVPTVPAPAAWDQRPSAPVVEPRLRVARHRVPQATLRPPSPEDDVGRLQPRAGTRTGQPPRGPQLRIGSIEVTVVPPAPAPQPQARPAVFRPRPRPPHGPDSPAPWFGLAQR